MTEMPSPRRLAAAPALSLRTKLAALFGLLFTLTALLTLAVSFWGVPFTSYQGIMGHDRQVARNALNTVADLKKDRLLNWLEERRNDFAFLMNNQFFVHGLRGLGSEIRRLRALGLPEQRLWQEIAALPEHQTMRQFLGQFLQVEGRYLSMEVLDAASGEVILSPDIANLGRRGDWDQAYQGALRARGHYVSDVHLAPDGVTSVIGFGQAIMDQGRPAAVVAAHANAEVILKPLLTSPEGGIDFGEALLVNSRAVTLTSLKHPLPDGSPARPLRHALGSAPTRLAAAGEEGFIEDLDYRGQPVFAAYRHVRLSSKMGWGLVIKRDRQEIVTPIYENLARTALVWAAALALVLLATLVLARALAGPLRKLAEVSRTVAAGDLDAVVPAFPRDEVGQLAEAFDTMLGRLRLLTHGLEGQVAARTAQLVEANEQLRQEIVQRQAAQDAKARSEQDYRRIVDTANEGICAVDASVRITFVNRKMAQMLGYAPEELLGQGLENHVHPDDREGFHTDVEKRRRGLGGSFERRYLRKDGGAIWALVNATPILDQQGVFQGSFAMFTDITERKEGEEVRRKSEARLRLALEAAKAGAWEWNLRDNRNYWSDELWPLYGLAPHSAEPSYQTWLDTVHPDDRERVAREVGEAAAKGEELSAQWRVNTAERRWLLSRGRPVHDAEGRVILYLGIVMDITQQKLTEQALAEERERLVVTLRSIGDGVITTDIQGRVAIINRVAEELTGWTQAQAEERDISEVFNIINEKTRQPCENPVAKVLESGGVVGLANHTLLISRDGSVRAIADSGAPIRDSQGRVIGVVLVFRDITQSVRVEGELRQAQKMEAIGTLAGGIAHDFNNILAAILGFAEMALDDARAGEIKPADLEQILLSAQRAKALVQQILAFSRKKEPDRRPLDLNQVIARTRAVLERTLPKMIGIEVSLAPALPPVLADPTQMEQVLLNLAANAADAMPEGGKMVIETRGLRLDQEFCSRHLEIRPGSYAMISLTDTGMGMDQETMDHIFDPFYTTKDIGKGTGLGLSSVYGIVKNHGGHIHCHSELGLGTSFRIYLPAVLEHQEADPREDEAPLGSQSAGRGETILLADDEEKLLDLGARTLEGKGYRVLVAGSGEEALETYKAQGGGVDLVVMDLGMPGMGGHKALKEILALNPGAKVVIASGYAADGQVKASLEAGAVGYVAKPFKRAEFLATVRQVLDNG